MFRRRYRGKNSPGSQEIWVYTSVFVRVFVQISPKLQNGVKQFYRVHLAGCFSDINGRANVSLTHECLWQGAEAFVLQRAQDLASKCPGHFLALWLRISESLSVCFLNCEIKLSEHLLGAGFYMYHISSHHNSVREAVGRCWWSSRNINSCDYKDYPRVHSPLGICEPLHFRAVWNSLSGLRLGFGPDTSRSGVL